MECVTAQVKRWLNAARNEHDSSSAQKAFQVLTAAAAAADIGTGAPPPSELFILCCEEAISLEQWEMAQKCVDAFQSQLTCNRMLEARALYCAAIVGAHFISEDLNWSEVVEERLHCASGIIRGITVAVEEWPREGWAVVHGIEKLWQVVAPLFQFGHFKCLIEIVAFVVSLHEKLMIGGGHTFVQWVTRLAVCLRGAGRVQDGISQLNLAMESAIRMNNERLQVQLLRMWTVFVAEGGGGNATGPKGKQELAAKGLIHQAVQLVQLFLVGQLDIQSAKPELLTVYDRLTYSGVSLEREAVASPSISSQLSAAIQSGKNKGKTRTAIPEVISDPEVLQEVLSDVVFCLAFCNEGKRCEDSIQKLLSSVNTRARTFGSYAKILMTAFDVGVFDVIDAPDSSYLTPAIISSLFRCIQEIESTMDGAKRIQDGSERSYALQVGCSLLWNFCLPLLQDSTHSHLQHVLSRIVKETDACCISRPSFQVMVEYESSLAEYNEDNLSLAMRRIRKALSRGYVVTCPDGTVYAPMNLSLLWLLRRCSLRVSADGSEGAIASSSSPSSSSSAATTTTTPSATAAAAAVSPASSSLSACSSFSAQQDLAMFYLEQAESATTTSKFMSFMKMAIAKLPLLTPDERADIPPLPTTTTDGTASASMGVGSPSMKESRDPAGGSSHNRAHASTGGNASTTSSSASSANNNNNNPNSNSSSNGNNSNKKKFLPSISPVPNHRPPRRSLTRLYLHILRACTDHLSYALLPLAKSCALSLCSMEVIPDVKYADYIFMKGHASLLLCKVLLMEYNSPTTSEEEKRNISARLFQALKDASAIASVLQGIGRSSAWITINACLLYLDYKAPTFSAGNFTDASGELGEMYHYFMALHIDFDRESRLTVNLSLFYLLSLLDDYVRAKGGFPTPPPPPSSYDEFIEAVFRFSPKTETKGNDVHAFAPLRRAHDVCVEVLQKIVLPSQKLHLSRLYPVICRFLNVKGGGMESLFLHHPQEQLLHYIGRLAGPISKEERKALLCREAWETLQQDPSVQLCGQVASFAMELREERLVLEICELAHQLFYAGKLGWGTMYVVAPTTVEKEKASKQDKKEPQTLTAIQNPKAVFPKPTYLDWLAYARLLRFQAEVLSHRSGGIHMASREMLSLEVLTHCTNSAIAASHGPPAIRAQEIVAAIQLYYRTISNLWKAGGGTQGTKVLLPSLKMILSHHILSHLIRVEGGNEKNGGGGGGGSTSDYGNTLSPSSSPNSSPDGSPLHRRSLPLINGPGSSTAAMFSSPGSHHRHGGGVGMAGTGGYNSGNPSAASGGSNGNLTTSSNAANVGIMIRYAHLYEVLSTLGHMMLRVCAAEGLFEDGMQTITSVLQVLPKKYHSSFTVQEVRFRCAVGLPVDQILHEAKSDDVETASLVWMTYAQGTSDQSKSVEAWKYAVNVLTGFPFSKANCLLEMVYHVSTHSLLPLREVQLLLLSALDLIEGFDRSVNESCVTAASGLQPIMDERARTYPGRLVGTLTGRSLMLAAMDASDGSSTVTTLRKNLPPIALRDLLLAVRIVFMLFTVAPYHLGPEEVNARIASASVGVGGGKGAAIPFVTKRECAILLLHYIDCLWRLAASMMAKETATEVIDSPTASPSCSASFSPSRSRRASRLLGPPSQLPPRPPPAPPLEIPKKLGGWFGFFFHEDHVKLFSTAGSHDFKHNTEGMQGIYFSLCQYLLEENMEQYCFMVYMWAAFSAGWRYGCDDVQYDVVRRTAFAGCEVAATLCRCGHQSSLYVLPELVPRQQGALDTKMEEVKAPNRPSPFVSGSIPSQSCSSSSSSFLIVFSPHIGSLQDIWIQRAFFLESFGYGERALEKIEKIKRRCALLEDWDNYAKCVLLQNTELCISRKCSAALEVLEKEEKSGLVEKLTPSAWEMWEEQKVELLFEMGNIKRLIDTCELFVSTAHQLREGFPAGTVGREVAEVLFPRLIEKYQASVIQHISRDVLGNSSTATSVGEGIPPRGVPGAPGERELKSFLVALCESLEGAGNLNVRMAVKECQFHLRAPLLRNPTMHNILLALTSLERESAQVESIFSQVAVTTGEMASALCLQTTDTPLRPTQNLLEAFFLLLQGENIMSRFRIAQAILDAYRCLTLEELGIPTGGPPDLEKHVLDFIRDPTKRRGPGSECDEQRWREAKWTRKMNDIDVETNNALDYYSIPRNLIRNGLSAFDCRAALYQAMEVVGPPFSQLYYTISKTLVRVELRCLQERELGVDQTHTLSVEERIEDLLNTRWSICPLVEVPKLVTNKKGGGAGTAGGGGAGGSSGSAAEKHRKGKEHHVGEWKPRIPPKELTETDVRLLSRLMDTIRDAAEKFDFTTLYECFLMVADLNTLWQRPQSAGTAVEFALTARLVGYLTELCFMMMEDTEERRMWRRFQRFLLQHPLLAYSPKFNSLRQATLDASPALSAVNLASEWPDEVESSTTFSFSDTVVLSIVQSKDFPQYFLVVLRHPDGTVDTRRKALYLGQLKELVTMYENFLEAKRQYILEESRRLGVSRQDTMVTAEDLLEFGRQAYPVLRPLVEEIEESLETLAAKGFSLFLCLDPVLQPLPFSYFPIFSSFTSVQRELSVIFIKRKLDIRNSKNATGVLQVIDPFGDYLPSVEGVGNEGKKGSKDLHLLTSTDKRFPFSTEYLMWILEQPSYQAVMFNMCGSLTSILSPVTAASIRWGHLSAVLIGADGVNESSMRREQKNELTKSARERLFDKKWLLPLLLLLRGVRYVAMNTCPTTPAGNDALCKRALPALVAGRGISDVAAVGPRHAAHTKMGKDTKKVVEPTKKQDLLTFYGVPMMTAKTKG